MHLLQVELHILTWPCRKGFHALEHIGVYRNRGGSDGMKVFGTTKYSPLLYKRTWSVPLSRNLFPLVCQLSDH